jgi:hypothetical protein
MRLLHPKSLELKEFIGQDIPPYVILSHTWGDGEVSFQGLQSGKASKKAGHQKILNFCIVVKKQRETDLSMRGWIPAA